MVTYIINPSATKCPPEPDLKEGKMLPYFIPLDIYVIFYHHFPQFSNE